MSPKRCLAVKKRGVLKEPLKNITPKLSLRQLSAVLRGCTDDGPKIEQLRQELRERLQSLWLQLCGWGAGPLDAWRRRGIDQAELHVFHASSHCKQGDSYSNFE